MEELLRNLVREIADHSKAVTLISNSIHRIGDVLDTSEENRRLTSRVVENSEKIRQSQIRMEIWDRFNGTIHTDKQVERYVFAVYGRELGEYHCEQLVENLCRTMFKGELPDV